MSTDFWHYLIEGAISACLVFLAFRRAPGERTKDNSGALKDYAETARIAGEEARVARSDASSARQETNETKQKMFEMERRLTVVERKRFRCVIDFEIGDPPTVGEVKIEPIIPPEESVQPAPKRKK